MKTRYLTFYILSTLTVASCSSDFLDIKGQGHVTTTTDPNLAQELVIGAYNGLLQGDSFVSGDIHGFAFISATNIMSDDADKGSTDIDQVSTAGQLDDFLITDNNVFVASLWSGHYSAIGNTNQALKALKTASIDAATITEYSAEMRFLRAFLYFNLVRMYGGVPLVLRVPNNAEDANSDPAFTTRADASVVYDSIVRDLQFAIQHLPPKATAVKGRATQGAAQGLLAKVYMYQENWPLALSTSSLVISSGQYQLVSDYASQFRQAGNNSSESLFEIQTGSFNNAPLRIDNYCDSQGPRAGGDLGWNDLGWGFNDPSASLVSAYEPGDLRKDGTIIFIDNSGTHKGTTLWDGFRIPSSDSVQNLRYNYKMYTSSTTPPKETYTNPTDKDRAKNPIILRYADILLINAEAAFHTGGDATTPLNLVRARAGLPAKSGVTLADIKQERHVELAMEDDRFWDLVRWGDAAAVMTAAGKTNFVAGKNELLPIPLTQILLSNNKLKQNNLY
jgi:hypothetical protein